MLVFCLGVWTDCLRTSVVRRLLFVFLLTIVIPKFCAARPVRADEPDAETEQPPDSSGSAPAASGPATRIKRFDPSVISAGMAAFERSCTTCHDAARSLERTKDLAGWRATARRMADKTDAEIAAEDIEPIAVYLASRASDGPAGNAEQAEGSDSGKDSSSLSAFVTASPLWRGGDTDVQYPGFIPDVWVGANWHSGILSARVTACTACHGVNEDPGFLQRIEVVEAVGRVDLSKQLDAICTGMKGNIEGGRFIVPFGAFSSQVNPSLYRTVSKPLMFNMGLRARGDDFGDPILPLPYVDEGVKVNLAMPLADFGNGPVTATADGYLVNGLIGNDGGIDFDMSRDLVDNNKKVAGGGRFTLGGPNIHAGASITGGQFNNPGADPAAFGGAMRYLIYGFDIQAHYKDLVRVQCEYAMRRSDRVSDFGSGPQLFNEKLDGVYVEGEVRPREQSRVSLLVRYDWTRRNSLLPPDGSSMTTGQFNVQRLTWGINLALFRQSLLMFNHEIWFPPEPIGTFNIFGIRYAITF